MKLKYKVRQLRPDQWVVYANKKQYFTTIYKTEDDAVYASLVREGTDLVDKLDDVQRRLEKTGRISQLDPHAWRA